MSIPAEFLPWFRRIAALVVCVWVFGCSAKVDNSPAGGDSATGEAEITIGVLPKLVGIDFFNAVEKGAVEAARELGVRLVYDGPVEADVTKQVAMVDSWIARKFDAIAIAPNDPDAIAPVLRKARARGVPVITFDADSQPDARGFFVNQCTYAAVAKTLVETMVKGIGAEGKYIYLTGSLTAANQNFWMEEMEKYIRKNYPKMVNLSEQPKPSEEDQALATQMTIDILKSYPEVQGIFGMTSVALPGAAEAVRKEKAASRVFVTGLSTPNSMRPFIKDGTVKEFVLWNPVDQGYLAVHACKAQLDGTLTEASTSLAAGRLGAVQVNGGEVLLGAPVVFNATNIDDYDF